MRYAYETMLGLEHSVCLTAAVFIIVSRKRSYVASNQPTSQNKTHLYLNTNCMP